MKKTVHILYFALLREQRGLSEETVTTEARTAGDFYRELKVKHHFTLSPGLLRVAINNEFQPLEAELKSGDDVVFIPPVAGG